MSIKDDANDNAIDSNDDISVYDVLTWCSNFDKKFIEDVNHDHSHYLLCGRHRRAGSQKVGRQRQALQRQRDCGENWSDWFVKIFLSDPGVPGVRSMGPVVSHWVSPRPFEDLTDMTLADEDTNSILTDIAIRTFQGNVAMQVTQPGGQVSNQCK